MGIGEAANFAAYAFAPASLVTPLGVLSVLVSAVLSSKYLGERLNLLGKVGCFLCVIGSTVIVLHSPKEGAVDSMEQLGQLLFEPGFAIYMVVILFSSSFLIVFCVPKYGSSNVVVYILICSVIGSLSVMECKGIGLALRETFGGGKNEFSNWLTWFFLIALIICITVQINYLNKALDTFNTSVVTPVYYVFFTTFVICASAILYKEWVNMVAEDIVGSICGFLTVICAIFLLNAFREWDISLGNISSLLQKKEHPVSNSHSQENVSTSILMDRHSLLSNETSGLLERHSRQNSLESRSFSALQNACEGSYSSLMSFTGK
ncbi:magnesium transporter NIPA2-like isoform X2 [Stegodyphus dumicola]|nr:magnesium transporter NIPA2-like isoform X2 [Stegodyphus dumicola]